MFVLLTDTGEYLVEYLFGETALSSKISEAKVFSNIYQAKNFQTLLKAEQNIICSVNTFIS